MIDKQLTTKFILVGAVIGAMLPALMLYGCAGHEGAGEDRDAEHEDQGEHGEERGEHGAEAEGSDQARQSREAETSSPITPLDQEWNGVLGGAAVAMRYDEATDSVHTTVRNTLSETICYVQVEPHLKAGTRTVGELGPDKLGDLEPGQEAASTLRVDSEPKLARVSFDGYVAHIEVYDCSGPGPTPHEGEEGAAGSDEHGSQGERGDQSAAGDEDGRGANALGLNETLDTVRSGGRLILRYHAPSNAFQRHGREHDQRHVLTPGQDRSAPVEWCGAWTDDSNGHGSRRGAGDRPTRDAGIVHRLDSTRRGRWRRWGKRVWRGAFR